MISVKVSKESIIAESKFLQDLISKPRLKVAADKFALELLSKLKDCLVTYHTIPKPVIEIFAQSCRISVWFFDKDLTMTAMGNREGVDDRYFFF